MIALAAGGHPEELVREHSHLVSRDSMETKYLPTGRTETVDFLGHWIYLGVHWYERCELMIVWLQD